MDGSWNADPAIEASDFGVVILCGPVRSGKSASIALLAAMKPDGAVNHRQIEETGAAIEFLFDEPQAGRS